MMRFPSSAKVIKPSRPGATATKGPLTSERQSTLPGDDPPQDVNLSAILYTTLRKLRTLIVKECLGGVLAYYIFGNATLQQISRKVPRTKEELLKIHGLGKAKVIKYGDRMLATIESTVNEFYGISRKDSNIDKDSPGSGKRRRDENVSPNVAEDDDFDVIPSQSCKKKTVRNNSNEIAYDDCVELLDFDFEDDGSEIRPEGRLLPW